MQAISAVVSIVMIAVGAALCIPPATPLGIGLLASGLALMSSTLLTMAGVDGKVASSVGMAIQIVAGIFLSFTPMAPLGWTLVGAGIGGLAGGWSGYGIDRWAGGNGDTGFAIGSTIGEIGGGIAGAKLYPKVQNFRAYRFLRSNGLTAEKATEALDAFDGIPSLKRLKADTTIYRVWGGESGEMGPWVSPKNYGANARIMLALPPENTAVNLSTFIIPSGTKVPTGTAAAMPKWGLPGGGTQWWLPLWQLFS